MDPAPFQNLLKCHVFCGSRVGRQDETDESCPGSKSIKCHTFWESRVRRQDETDEPFPGSKYMEMSRILGVESAHAG